jgi:DNA-binding CsgD family transcriptional regulator
MRDGKVAEVWLMTDRHFDYREKHEHALQNALPSLDDKATLSHFRQVITSEQYSVHGQLQNVELTDREFDVLFYTMQGLTAKQIDQRLNLSFRTIESYIETLKDKFDCDSKSALRRKVTPGAVWF